MMELNRNQFLLIGLVIMLLGLQLRAVEAYVLNETSTKFLARQKVKAEEKTIWNWPTSLAADGKVPITRKRIEPPRWLAWALVCTGGVLILHSFALQKPD
jgi:hypothetical protein